MAKTKKQPIAQPPKGVKWEPDAKIEITGQEYAAIQGVLALFETAILVKNQILKRMIEDGTAVPMEDEKV